MIPSRNENEEKNALRFGLILAPLLALVAAWSFVRGRPARGGALAVAAVLVAGCTVALFPLWLAFFRRWMRVVLVISGVTTAILLGAFFYLFLTPIAIARRLLGKAPLDVTWKDRRATYWIDRKQEEATIERYEKPF